MNTKVYKGKYIYLCTPRYVNSFGSPNITTQQFINRIGSPFSYKL